MLQDMEDKEIIETSLGSPHYRQPTTPNSILYKGEAELDLRMKSTEHQADLGLLDPDRPLETSEIPGEDKDIEEASMDGAAENCFSNNDEYSRNEDIEMKNSPSDDHRLG